MTEEGTEEGGREGGRREGGRKGEREGGREESGREGRRAGGRDRLIARALVSYTPHTRNTHERNLRQHQCSPPRPPLRLPLLPFSQLSASEKRKSEGPARRGRGRERARERVRDRDRGKERESETGRRWCFRDGGTKKWAHSQGSGPSGTCQTRRGGRMEPAGQEDYCVSSGATRTSYT